MLLSCGMFYKCHVSSIGGVRVLHILTDYVYTCPNSIKRNVEVSAVMVDLSISLFCSISFCFKYFEVSLVGLHILRIVTPIL